MKILNTIGNTIIRTIVSTVVRLLIYAAIGYGIYSFAMYKLQQTKNTAAQFVGNNTSTNTPFTGAKSLFSGKGNPPPLWK